MIDPKIFKSEITIIPWNENNTHWCLLILDNKTCRFAFFDPMKFSSVMDSVIIKEYIEYLKTKKMIKRVYTPIKLEHSKQIGAWSCGYFILIVTL